MYTVDPEIFVRHLFYDFHDGSKIASFYGRKLICLGRMNEIILPLCVLHKYGKAKFNR